MDAIVTGGADFDMGATAYAGEYPSSQIATPSPAPAPEVVTEAAAETEALKTAAADDIDYSFTTEELLGGLDLVTVSVEPIIDLLAVEGDKPVEAMEPVAETATKDETVL